MLDIAAFCLVITALLAYLNHRFVGLTTAIGVMVAALAPSLGAVALSRLGITRVPLRLEAELLRSIDFNEVLMQGMLSPRLFAGALHVDLSELKAYRWQIGALALLGTVLSTLAVGNGVWLALPLVGLELLRKSPPDAANSMGWRWRFHAPGSGVPDGELLSRHQRVSIKPRRELTHARSILELARAAVARCASGARWI